MASRSIDDDSARPLREGKLPAMCNLYSITRSQDAMRQLFAATHDLTGNLPPLPDVYPDQLAPIVRVADGERQLEMMRWGMPGPPAFGGAPVTNIRNTKSPHWRRWLGSESRCLVPVNSFCEWADTKPRKTPTWFALKEDRPLFAFAGIWTTWRGVRGPKSAPVDGEHRLYGFLTTDANGIVGPIHPKARCCSPRPMNTTCGSVRRGARLRRCSDRCQIRPCGSLPAGRARISMMERRWPR